MGLTCAEAERREVVLVGADTGGFQSWGRHLLILVRHHVHAHGEVIDAGLLTTKIVDTDLRVGNTTVVPGLGVGLDGVLSVSLENHHRTIGRHEIISDGEHNAPCSCSSGSISRDDGPF